MPAPPMCPRCGYDLSGAIATWTETCPLNGLCTECGLTFENRMVLNERLRRQARFFEVAMSSLTRACITTGQAALWPWKFWRWVMMEHEVRYGRMLVGVGVGVVMSMLRMLLIALVVAAV